MREKFSWFCLAASMWMNVCVCVSVITCGELSDAANINECIRILYTFSSFKTVSNRPAACCCYCCCLCLSPFLFFFFSCFFFFFLLYQWWKSMGSSAQWVVCVGARKAFAATNKRAFFHSCRAFAHWEINKSLEFLKFYII